MGTIGKRETIATATGRQLGFIVADSSGAYRAYSFVRHCGAVNLDRAAAIDFASQRGKV